MIWRKNGLAAGAAGGIISWEVLSKGGDDAWRYSGSSRRPTTAELNRHHITDLVSTTAIIPFFSPYYLTHFCRGTKTLFSFALDFDTLEHLAVSQLTITMPSATGESWEKYKKNFADEEEPEKKITPLTDEYVLDCVASRWW